MDRGTRPPAGGLRDAATQRILQQTKLRAKSPGERTLAAGLSFHSNKTDERKLLSARQDGERPPGSHVGEGTHRREPVPGAAVARGRCRGEPAAGKLNTPVRGPPAASALWTASPSAGTHGAAP